MKKVRKRSRSKMARFLRSALMIAACCGVLLCAYMVIAKIAHPYLISYSESKDIVQVRKEIAEARAENSTLKRDMDFLKTPQGREAEARKLGWVKPGEIALVVERPEPEKKEAAKLESPVQVIRESFSHLFDRDK
ncbi:MAG: FtsB family cell division protein [Armatimonadota bacterium]